MQAQKSDGTAKRVIGRPFKKGQCANPGGRPKLPAEIRAMKEDALEKAITILHDKINDSEYIRKLKPSVLFYFLEVAFDRFGLPKVTHQQVTGADGLPLIPPPPPADLSKLSLAELKALATIKAAA